MISWNAPQTSAGTKARDTSRTRRDVKREAAGLRSGENPESLYEAAAILTAALSGGIDPSSLKLLTPKMLGLLSSEIGNSELARLIEAGLRSDIKGGTGPPIYDMPAYSHDSIRSICVDFPVSFEFDETALSENIISAPPRPELTEAAIPSDSFGMLPYINEIPVYGYSAENVS